MICPKCEYEYIDSVKTCPDCGTKLVSSEEFEGNLVHHSDWCVVCSCGSNIEAEMMKTNLESADIETLILSQSDSSFPVDGNMKVVKVLVRKKDSSEAETIIEDIQNNPASDTD